MPQHPRTKWLIVAGAGVVVVALAVALFVRNERDVHARAAVRKQTAFVMLDLTAEMDAAAVTMHAFNADGGLDLSGLEDPAALDRRIALASKAEAAAAGVVKSGEALPDRLGAALEGVPADRVAEAQQQLPQKANWAQGRRIFQTHADAYAAAGKHLRFLKQHHGRWRVDPVGLRVNWDSQQLQAEAEALHAQVTAAAAAQGALSREAVGTGATTTGTETRPAAQGR